MQKVGFGVIGCGVISTAYLKSAQRFANLELRAVADMRSAAAEKQGATFGVPALRVDQLLKRDDIEIVVNLTVPLAHTDVSLAILNAGKHVHSEKPLGVSVAEARKVTDLAAAKGLRVGSALVARPGRYHASVLRASELRNVSLSSRFVPALVTGYIRGGRGRRRRDLAIAVNGQIVATGRSFFLRGSGQEGYAVIVPEIVFRPGRNQVHVLSIGRRGKRLRFRLLAQV